VTASKTPHLNTNESLPYNNGERGFEAPGREVDKGRDGLDLVEALVHRFQNHPHCFHLKWPPGESPPDDVVYGIVNHVMNRFQNTLRYGSRPSAVNNVHLTDCRCDLSGGNESRDPWHLAYQDACLKLVKAYVSLFEELSPRNGTEDGGTIHELENIFMNMTQSRLLKDCRLDTELLSLCRMFFELAARERCLTMSSHGEENKGNMLKWFKVSILAASRCDLVSGY